MTKMTKAGRLRPWSRWLAAAGAAAGLGATSVAHAEPIKLLICAPGGPGSTEDAASRLTGFFAAFEKRTGMTVRGEYHTNEAACDRYFKAESPVLAMFPYAEYVASAQAKSLIPVVQVVRKGQGENRFFLVAKKGRTLDELKGKKLLTAHLTQADVLSRAAFGGKIDIAKDFAAEAVASSLKAIKSLAKGQTDAILLDENEYSSLAGLPFAGELEAVLTSSSLPGIPLAVVGGDTALADKLRAALPGLCTDAPDACAPIEVEKLLPADPSTYRALLP